MNRRSFAVRALTWATGIVAGSSAARWLRSKCAAKAQQNGTVEIWVRGVKVDPRFDDYSRSIVDLSKATPETAETKRVLHECQMEIYSSCLFWLQADGKLELPLNFYNDNFILYVSKQDARLLARTREIRANTEFERKHFGEVQIDRETGMPLKLYGVQVLIT
jgi:hypothetical protein